MTHKQIRYVESVQITNMQRDNIASMKILNETSTNSGVLAGMNEGETTSELCSYLIKIGWLQKLLSRCLSDLSTSALRLERKRNGDG